MVCLSTGKLKIFPDLKTLKGSLNSKGTQKGSLNTDIFSEQKKSLPRLINAYILYIFCINKLILCSSYIQSISRKKRHIEAVFSKGVPI